MTFRNVLAALGLLANILSTSAQDVPSVPATRRDSNVLPSTPGTVAPAPPAISPDKLTDARETARALANGKAKVIVLLSSPVELGKADFASRASLAVLRTEIKKLQQDVLAQLPADHVKDGHRFDNIAGFSAEVSAEGLKALQAHPQVVSIEPVFVLKPHLAQGIQLIGGMTFRSIYNGAGVAIAICDSGVDYNHPRLGGGGFPNSKVIGGYDFGSSDANPLPNGEAHGTACAGIAAGDLGTVGDYIGGVAYNAKLYALKITSGTGDSATTADMVAAWDWCVTHKDDNPDFPILVISTSFGGGQYFATCDSATPSMTTAANNAAAAGITVVASSGNEGFCNALAWPSCISSVISVGAVYDASFGHYFPCIEADSCAAKIPTTGCATSWYADDTTAADKVTSYANVAPFLTLFAPGNQCYTLDITGQAGYSNDDYFSGFGGTSASCPYVAGAVACLQSAARVLTGNYLTPQQVRTRLTSFGDNVTDTKVAITKPRVNLERAIQSIGTNPVLNFVSATLVGGNGNQSVEPNECNELRVILRNDGRNTATNVSATLSTLTPGVTVIQQSSAYPNLANTATGTNSALFGITTSPAFVCGTPLNLTLVVIYGGGADTNSFSLSSGSADYIITQSSGAPIVPGTTDIGNHGDSTSTTISLPFPYSFYGQTFSSATVNANGNLQFNGAANSSANTCLPAPGFAESIFAFWDNLRTDGADGPTQGIYTSTSGASPNRIFNIEWRASYYHPGRHGALVNFEVRLFENQSRFDLVYGTLNGDGSTASVGAQKSSAGPFTQFECNAGGLSSGLQLTFQTVCPDGGGPCGGSTVADFVGGPTNGTAPLTVSFTNFSSGAAAYAWDFGDGHTSTAQHPVNVYSNPGSYTVTLTTTGAGGPDSRTRTDYIVVIPPAQLVVTPPSLDFGLIPTGATKQATLIVSNAGGAVLQGTASVVGGPFSILSGMPFSLPQSRTTNVAIHFAPATAGAFSNVVVFTSTGGASTNAVMGRAAGTPLIVLLTLNGSEFAFSVDTTPGLAYSVQYKNSLDDSVWQTLQSLPGDGTTKTITNSLSAPSQRFYRLLVQ